MAGGFSASDVFNTIHSWLFWGVLLGVAIAAKSTTTLQENIFDVFGTVGASFVMNMTLQLSFMVKQELCGHYMGIVSFWVAQHMTCLHMRMWRLLLCRYDQKFFADKPCHWTWDVFVRSPRTWWLYYVGLSLMSVNVTLYSAIERAKTSPFLMDGNCYVDLGESVMVIVYVFSCLSLMAGIWGFYYFRERYLACEAVLILLLQIALLTPALVGYIHAYATAAPEDLKMVRDLISAYNTCILAWPCLPLVWLNWRNWKDVMSEWVGKFKPIWERYNYTPVPVTELDDYDYEALALTQAPVGSLLQSQTEFAILLGQVRQLTVDDLKIALNDTDHEGFLGLDGQVHVYIRAAKQVHLLGRYLRVHGQYFLWDKFMVLMREYNNKNYLVPVTRQDKLKKVTAAIYRDMLDKYKVYAPPAPLWKAIQAAGTGEVQAVLFASFLLKILQAILQNATQEETEAQRGQETPEPDGGGHVYPAEWQGDGLEDAL